MHNWTEDQRIVLHQLHAQFGLDGDAPTRLFNNIFSTNLRRTVIESQYSKRNQGVAPWLWAATKGEPTKDAEIQRVNGLIQRIHTAAAALRVNLQPVALPTHQAVRKDSDRTTEDVEGRPRKRMKGYVLATDADHLAIAEMQAKNGHMAANLNEPPEGKRRKSEQSTKTKTNSAIGHVNQNPPNAQGAKSTTSEKNEHDDKENRPPEKEPEQQPEEEPQAPAIDPKASRPPYVKLPMIHHKDITWSEYKQASTPSIQNAFVDQHNRVYEHGGQVHRVSFGDHENVDCMICDTTFCFPCGKNANPAGYSRTARLPFVHVSDISRPEGPAGEAVNVFDPAPNKHGGPSTKVFGRYVRFLGVDGIVGVDAAVCDLAKCKVCAGAKEERKSENEEVLDKAVNAIQAEAGPTKDS